METVHEPRGRRSNDKDTAYPRHGCTRQEMHMLESSDDDEEHKQPANP